MHIDRADEIAVSDKPAGATRPLSVLGLVFVPASGTPATGSSFGAGEAQDAGLFCFVTEVVDILAVLPQRHALVVVPALVRLSDAVRIADEESSYLVLNAEVDHGPRRFMAQITDAALRPPAYSILGPLEFFPAARAPRATGLLIGKLPQLPVALPLERTDATPGDDHGRASSGRHRRQMNLAQVDRRLPLSRRRGGDRDFHADMQFKAAVPDQGTGAGFFGQSEGQNERLPPSAHRQDHSSLLFSCGLGGPVDGVEAFCPPRVLHAHLGMGLAQLAGRVDVGEEGAEDRLNRLAMQRKTVLGGLLHLAVSRPRGMLLARGPVQVAARVPDPCRFHLGRFEPLEEPGRKVVESIDRDGLHNLPFFFLARKAVEYSMSGQSARGACPRPCIMSYERLKL